MELVLRFESALKKCFNKMQDDKNHHFYKCTDQGRNFVPAKSISHCSQSCYKLEADLTLMSWENEATSSDLFACHRWLCSCFLAVCGICMQINWKLDSSFVFPLLIVARDPILAMCNESSQDVCAALALLVRAFKSVCVYKFMAIRLDSNTQFWHVGNSVSCFMVELNCWRSSCQQFSVCTSWMPEWMEVVEANKGDCTLARVGSENSNI